MYTPSILTKNTLRNVFSLLTLLVLTYTAAFAQVDDTNSPVFEIVKIQDGSESGDDVVYMVKLTDGAGRPLVNTTNEDFSMDIEFGVDSDVARDDMATEFPTAIVIPQGKSNTVIRLKVLNDGVYETTESLVAMIYNPSIGTVSETLNYATATVANDPGNTPVPAKTFATATKNQNNNPVITMLQK